jgi:hypothetical protein
MLIINVRGDVAWRAVIREKVRANTRDLSSRDYSALWLRGPSFRHAHELHRRLRIVAFYLSHALVLCAEALASIDSLANHMPNNPKRRTKIVVRAI